MFRNYLKIALRNIIRYKGYSFINIAGLALGIACCILILLWVLHELSYDKFHQDAKRLYRVEQDQNYSGRPYHVNVTPYPMAPVLKDEIPEVVDATRFVYTGGVLVRYQNKSFFENGLRAVDPSFLQMFTFPLIKGNSKSVLNEPKSIVISRQIAEKYFGSEEPVGKILEINNQYNFTVTGVLERLPDNTVFEFDILFPYEAYCATGQGNDNWGSNSIVTLVQLHEHAKISDVNEKISVIRQQHVREKFLSDPEKRAQFESRSRVEFSIRPVSSLHLHAYFGFSQSMGAIQYVYMFSMIAVFVLLIACINFMNLSTARSANRAQEIGLRKVVGATRQNIIGQFFGESLFMTLISLFFALVLVSLFLPVFNTISGKHISFGILAEGKILLSLLGITGLTGILAGSYPALFLSGFQPVTVLKGTIVKGQKGAAFRKVLVIVQFALSIFLIIGTAVVYHQLQFIKNKDLGYEKEHLLYIQMRGDIQRAYPVLKNELIKDAHILSVTASTHPPSHIGSNSSGADWDGKDPNQSVLVGIAAVDFDYTETMKIKIVEGRGFSPDFPADTADGYLINEELRRIMGGPSVVGKRFDFAKKGKIVGVMKDFHFLSLKDKIDPLAILLSPRNAEYIIIRIQPQQVTESIEVLKKIWAAVIPDYPLEYHFLDEDFERTYRAEQRMGELLKYFTLMAVAIACLGLFSLASFVAAKRTKEIGIRKVLGATVPHLVGLLCREFLLLVFLANLIAWPITWYATHRWLQGFAYRVTPSWTIFFLALVVAVLIALLTVSFQAIRAALSNPVDSLKYE